MGRLANGKEDALAKQVAERVTTLVMSLVDSFCLCMV